MPDSVLCVSVRQPWADLVAAGVKPVENRSFPLRYRGPLLIHAGKTWGREEKAAYDQLLQIAIDHRDQRRQAILFNSRHRLGGLVGLVRVVGCYAGEDWYREGGRAFNGWDEWFVGPYGWQLREAAAFPLLAPCKGEQGLFRVPLRAVPAEFQRRIA